MNWINVGNINDIPRLGSRIITSDWGKIAIFRTSDDQVFAVNNRCPHRGGDLAQGIVHGHTVTCPLHNWKIDLASGKALAPDEGCTRRYEVEVKEDGTVMLGVKASLKAVA